MGRRSASAEKTEPGRFFSARAVEPGSGPGHAPKLDRLIHGRLRLGIMSALAVNDTLTFADLKEILQATDGNLSVHARKLEEAGYVDCRKYFAGRQPRTEYQVTTAGRRALERYLSHMESLIEATRQARTGQR